MAHPTSASTESSLCRNQEALSIAAQAKVLSGLKLEQLVTRIQRRFGHPKEVCWRFIIQYGLKETVDHRRWSDVEEQVLYEELLSHSVEEVADRLHRSPEAVRSKLKRDRFNLRGIRGNCLSLENIVRALGIERAEIIFWIEQGWLPASVRRHGGKPKYSISREALHNLHDRHLPELLKRKTINYPLFEAYLHYCCSPTRPAAGESQAISDDRAAKCLGEPLAGSRSRNTNREEEDDENDQDARYGISN